MPQFVYSITGNRKPDEVGLSYAFETSPPFADGAGPEGVAGRLYSVDPDAIRYAPDEQDWCRIAEGVHVGCLRDDKPTPDDLKRSTGFDGELLTLPCGEWLVPRLRVYVAGQSFRSVFPTTAEWQDGEWYTSEVLPEHAEADRLAGELIEFMLAAADGDAVGTMSDAEPLDYAVRILQVNYRVGPAELNLIGKLPIDERLAKIIHIATDYEAAIEHALGKEEAHVA